ncbi:MAG TPA: DUF962 domain-containing protein [Polyangiaceae bacterium]|jgi:hypothetical protein|nr:DUF962 domain-containing protein [Polyangiaceae bacterium]
MANSSNVNTFNDFWPRYLRAHRSRASRAFHLGGVVLSVALAAALVSCGMIFFLVLAIVPAQLGAAIGHKLSPRKDRVLEDHPDWAAVADVRMCSLMVTGRLGREIAALAELPSVPSTSNLAA